jgi:FHS family L-fucose permease-like MFS transporter
MRINLSQAFNGVGTVIAPVLGSYVLFTFSDEEALANVQWVYLAIAVFVLILAGLFFISNIPEITDAGEPMPFSREAPWFHKIPLTLRVDMALQVQETHADADEKPFIKQYKLFHATLAQFCYTGAQVAIASFFINYATSTRVSTGDKGRDNSIGAQLFAGAQAAFAIGRFIGVALMKFVRPRLVFLAFIVGAIIFMLPAIAIPETEPLGNSGVAMLFVVLFFESICFPTIVALGMRGLGRHSKRGSGYIIAGVAGGAVVPPLTGAVSDARGSGIGMIVPMCFFFLPLTYAYAVNFVSSYVKVVDSFGEAEIGVGGHILDIDAEKAKTEGAIVGAADEKETADVAAPKP